MKHAIIALRFNLDILICTAAVVLVGKETSKEVFEKRTPFQLSLTCRFEQKCRRRQSSSNHVKYSQQYVNATREAAKSLAYVASHCDEISCKWHRYKTTVLQRGAALQQATFFITL